MIYAIDLADEQDQLVGWGLRVVVDEAIAAGADVVYPQQSDCLPREPDAWFLSLPYAGDAWRIAEFCDAYGISLDPAGRSGPPLILGGHGVVNYVPLLDVADAVYVGEGDDRAAEIVEALRIGPDALSDVPGIATVGSGPVTWQIASGLGKRGLYESRGGRGAGETKYLEVARGCKGGCRFCELGWLYGYDERSRKETASLMGPGVVLSAPDTDGVSYYSDMILSGAYSPRWRSTRVTGYMRAETHERDDARMRIRFGVEGATPRLRALCGKRIEDDRLHAALLKARQEGYRSVRIFLIGGLPTETTRDRMHVETIMEIASAAGWPWNLVSIKITGLSPQPLTPWQRLPVLPALEALADYREWRRDRSKDDKAWRSVMVDRHSTEADAIKRMRGGELLPYLTRWRETQGRINAARPGSRWLAVRESCYAAGIDYDHVVLGPLVDPLPWAGLMHTDRVRLDRGERSALRAAGISPC